MRVQFPFLKRFCTFIKNLRNKYNAFVRVLKIHASPSIINFCWFPCIMKWRGVLPIYIEEFSTEGLKDIPFWTFPECVHPFG